MLATKLIPVTLTLALAAAPAASEDFDFGLLLENFALRIATRSDDDYRGRHRRPRYEHHEHVPVHAAPVYQPAPVYCPTPAPAPVYVPQRVWVEGAYVNVSVRRWVEGSYETVYVPAEYRYETFVDHCGVVRTRTVLVREACTQQIWRPGYWVDAVEQRWVPGHWEDL